MKLRNLTSLIKETFSDWTEDKAPRLGAALAYYAIFSIPPLVLLAISAVGLVYEGDVRGAMQQQLAGLIGSDTAATIMETTRRSSDEKDAAAGVFGIALLLVGASGVFAQLQDAMNTIWEVQPKPGRGIFGMIKDRFLSFTMVLGIAFLLLVSLMLSAAVAAFGTLLGAWLPGGETVAHVFEFALSLGVTTLLFAMIFKLLPDVKIGWNDVWVGATATALLFTAGKFILGLYLGKGSIGSAYGAAGSVVIMIVWVYYSAQILFLGAEFTQVYANKYGSRVVPRENATPVSEKKRAEEGLSSTSKKALSNNPPRIHPVVLPKSISTLAGMILGFILTRHSKKPKPPSDRDTPSQAA
jgi:membrane protein